MSGVKGDPRTPEAQINDLMRVIGSLQQQVQMRDRLLHSIGVASGVVHPLTAPATGTHTLLIGEEIEAQVRHLREMAWR